MSVALGRNVDRLFDKSLLPDQSQVRGEGGEIRMKLDRLSGTAGRDGEMSGVCLTRENRR